VIDVPVRPNRVAAGDLTGNGALDVIVLCQNDLAVLLSGRRGQLAEAARYFAGYCPNSIAIADVNDGYPDLIVGSRDVVPCCRRRPAGSSAMRSRSSRRWERGFKKVLAADFNGDGRTDIAAVGEGMNMLNI
jgi:hypothetical protein